MPKTLRKKLLENGSEEHHGKDHFPVVKIELMGTKYTWLLTELNPTKQNIAFGLYNDMSGVHFGKIDLDELAKMRGPDCNGKGYSFIFTKEELAAPVPYQDPCFTAECPISVYKDMAEEFGAIVTGRDDNWEIWRRHTRNWQKKNQ